MHNLHDNLLYAHTPHFFFTYFCLCGKPISRIVMPISLHEWDCVNILEEEQNNHITHDEITSYGLLKYLLHFKGSKIIHYLDEKEGF